MTLDLSQARWFAGKGSAVGAFSVVEERALGPGSLLVLDVDGSRYAVPVVAGREALPGSGVYAAMVSSMGLPAGEEVALGADQSHVSVRVGDVLVKSYRLLSAGGSVEAEVGRFLAGRFAHAPALEGSLELGGATVAVAHAFVDGAADAYETLAEGVASGASPDLALMDELGRRLRELHVVLGSWAPPRRASSSEMGAWAADARAAFAQALDRLGGEGEVLAGMAGTIARELDALADMRPVVQRVHGDLHLGQVLLGPHGPLFIDFEGDPLLTPAQRRAPMPALRDLATLRRSIDHAGRSGMRRSGGRVDASAWIAAALGRLTAAYGDVDEAEVRALEVAKECFELLYAATYLPSWLWAPVESLRALLAGK